MAKRDPLRPVIWKLLLFIVASQFYLFWALLAAFLLFAVLAIPGSLVFATWWMLWKESKSVEHRDLSASKLSSAGKPAAETVAHD